MIPHQTYIIESILATGALYVIYLLALRNRPMLVFNRFMLLGMVFLGTLLPFINFSLPQNTEIPTSSFLIEEVFVNIEKPVEIEKTGFQFQYLYFFIAFVLFIYFTVQAIHLLRLRRNSEVLNDGSKTYNLIDGKYPHFSFFNQIFINKKLIGGEDELETIIEHEKVHVQQWHSLDILFFEISKIIFWFNPFIWLLKKLAIENHEYLADKGMLKQTSKNLGDYFNELLQNSLFTYKITLANNFNHSLLKKRVVMMTKKLKTVERLIPLFILPILIFVGIFFACSESIQVLGEQPEEESKVATKDENRPNDQELFFVVEEMPQFNGGDHSKFREYVQDSLVYPKEAVDKGIVGRVFVQFTVSSDGKVRDAIVVRGVDPLLDAEALRVVNSSPYWTPGKQRGKKVAVQFTFPITFMTDDKKVQEEPNEELLQTKVYEANEKPTINDLVKRVEIVDGKIILNLYSVRSDDKASNSELKSDKDFDEIEFFINENNEIENLRISNNFDFKLTKDIKKKVEEENVISLLKNLGFSDENLKSKKFLLIIHGS